MNTYDLYVNTKASTPRTGLSRSITNNTPVRMRDLIVGDKYKFNLYLSDGEGGVHDDSGSEYLVPTIAIGTPGLAPTSGVWALKYPGPKSTVDMAASCTTAQIKDAHDDMVGFSATDLTVTGEPGRWIIEYGGDLELSDMGTIEISKSTLSPLSWIVVKVVQVGGITTGNHIILVNYGQYAMAAGEGTYVGSDHWEVALDLDTPPLLSAIGSAQTELTFEIELDGAYGYTGNNATLVQTPVVMYNDLIKHHGLEWFKPWEIPGMP
jgi:hypothetical protein